VANTSPLPWAETSGRVKDMSKENTTNTTIGFILAFIGALILIIDAVTFHLAVNARYAAAGILLGLLILLFSFRAYTTKGRSSLGYSLLVLIIGIIAVILIGIILYLLDIITVLGGIVAVLGSIFSILGRRAKK
jgi:FtsH-binding integral membrane protein